MRYAVIVRGAAVAPGTPQDGAVTPHPGAVLDEPTEEPRACKETKKDGSPCGGRPGPDDLCAAHKRDT